MKGRPALYIALALFFLGVCCFAFFILQTSSQIGKATLTVKATPTVQAMARATEPTEPTCTPTPTDTPPPPAMPGPTPTLNPCLYASYVADVTVPDGARFDTGVTFVKTWCVRNSGKCNWDLGVAITLESGDRMDAPDSVTVGAVKIGQQIEISVPMKSPAQAGTYKGVWRMRDPSGNLFGEQFTVIVVAGNATPTKTPIPTRTAKPSPTHTSAPMPPRYVPILGKIWRGVEVYYGTGSDKTYGFQILGGSEKCPSMPSGRGILVRYSNGTVEWKDRNYIVMSGIYFVREDDPAIRAMDWYVFPNCP